MKLSKEDFKASITAEGYFITYKGKGIGGASILGKSTQRGKARMRQMHDHATSAQREIDQLVSGNGAKYMRDAIKNIDDLLEDEALRAFEKSHPELNP